MADSMPVALKETAAPPGNRPAFKGRAGNPASILKPSAAVAAFVEDETQLEKLRPAFGDLPAVRAIIVMDERFKGGDGKRRFPFDAVLGRGRARRAQADPRAARRGQLAGAAA